MSNMKDVIEQSFIQYSGAVLQSRALIDVRDCLKPSARQIFYCLYTDKFLPTKPFKKTLKAIGSVARMYIHGDASAEGIIMRAGQNFSMRYPLIEIEGNAGNLMMSGNWAAPRYTASRLSDINTRLFCDIEKNTIKEWRDNYDDTEKYPTVLPTKGFYNIVNGSMGIGVGAASSIPQFNIKDVNKALETLLLNPNCEFEDIYCQPDFATGGVLLNEDEVKESLKNGTGSSCKLRSVIEFDPKEKVLIVTEIPYSVYTNTICNELEAILQDESNPGIESFNDLTGSSALIKIYLSKKANPDKVINYLYKNTSLQSYYGINMVMLEDGKYPRVFSWKEALQSHINHEKEVYRRGFEYDLKKIADRIHILEGLLICCANIEEVVKVIKLSNSSAAANIALQKNFLLDEDQAKAVLDMKLARLSHLEVNKLQKEKDELIIEKDRIESILHNQDLFNEQLISGWREISLKLGDDHKTKIKNLDAEQSAPTEIKKIQISITNKNNLYITEVSSLYIQKRGSVGNKIKLPAGEFVCDAIIASTNDLILFFTNQGNYYHYKAEDIEIDTCVPLTSILNIKDNEEICSIVGLNTDSSKKNVLIVTKNGIIKKTKIPEYNTNRAVEMKAISLEEGDEIIDVLFSDSEKIGVLTNNGNFLITETDDIRPIGRVAKGIKLIKLDNGNFVVGAKLIRDSAKEIVSITKAGLIKRTKMDDFNIQGKNTKGSKIQKINEDDCMADFLPVNDLNEIIINATSSCIKIPMVDVPVSSRGALGAKGIKLKQKDKVICLT